MFCHFKLTPEPNARVKCTIKVLKVIMFIAYIDILTLLHNEMSRKKTLRTSTSTFKHLNL